MKGLILAGGKGTRLRPLTINTPKPIVPVANAPFLLYQIDLMTSGGIEDIILSLSYQPRKIEDLLKDGLDYGVRIRYAVEASPLGTGGAFKNAEEHIDSTTVVFNGDVLSALDLSAVIAHHRERTGSGGSMVLTPVENPSGLRPRGDHPGRLGQALHRKTRAARDYVQHHQCRHLRPRTIGSALYAEGRGVLV